MLLYHATASPFVRKVLVLAYETGFVDRIELKTEQVTPVAPNNNPISDNPLSRVLCLFIDDGMALGRQPADLCVSR